MYIYIYIYIWLYKRIINLSLNELKLIVQNTNMSDYENKSEKDLIKELSGPKPKIRINKKKIKN